MKLKFKISKIFKYACALVGVFATIYPLYFTFISSFKSNDEIYNNMFALPSTFQLHNYLEAFIKGGMAKAIMNSFILASGATVLFLLCSVMVSFVITRMKVKFASFLSILFAFGVMIPIHSTLIPIVNIAAKFQLYNNVVFMIFLYGTFQLSISIYIISGYMRSISKELEEAAIIDGCSLPRILFQIMFPLCAPAIATAGILGFLAVYNDLIFAVLFLTDDKLKTISLGLMSFVGQFSTHLGPRFAAIIVSILPMIIVYLVLQEKVEKGVMAGSIKG